MVLVFVFIAMHQGCAETFGGAGAQSIKGAHGAWLLIGCALCWYVYWNGCFCIDTAANAMSRVWKRNTEQKRPFEA